MNNERVDAVVQPQKRFSPVEQHFPMKREWMH